jgi:hypothetical protein
VSQRIEIQHHTPEQVREYMQAALVIVAELELDDELRPLAFTKAVDLLAAKNVQMLTPQPIGLPLDNLRGLGGR